MYAMLKLLIMYIIHEIIGKRRRLCTVKNKSEKQCTYYITIEAVDANGARIETDVIYADRLGAGQEIYLKAFEYVDQEKLNQFKNATFRVLEINKYDY